jgi:hypothetical protein
VRPFAVIPVLIAFLPAVASACSVCYSDPASAESAGRNWAVAVLLVFIVPILVAVGATGSRWIQRDQAAEDARVAPRSRRHA